ncbi:hypothetical protein SCLCIDRAFT_34732 [Scleroderma citrinum Foug A]|uniref:Uncharacterized protein n=1 Tax=Scleroderma citrinum Foug A TaxID=1036808 RepID=A0A0C2YJW0_9AGAM|nr:hypothetical protein SCLCIDRAFT_34732 [Scleroderma citrinum Foug A]
MGDANGRMELEVVRSIQWMQSEKHCHTGCGDTYRQAQEHQSASQEVEVGVAVIVSAVLGAVLVKVVVALGAATGAAAPDLVLVLRSWC